MEGQARAPPPLEQGSGQRSPGPTPLEQGSGQPSPGCKASGSLAADVDATNFYF
jgi:hypothetical protein